MISIDSPSSSSLAISSVRSSASVLIVQVPTGLSYESDLYYGSISIKWDKQPGNVQYRVFREDMVSSNRELIANTYASANEDSSKIYYVDNTIELDHLYVYQVQACVIGGEAENCSGLSSALDAYVDVYIHEDIEETNQPLFDSKDNCDGVNCAVSITGILWPTESTLDVAFDFTFARSAAQSKSSNPLIKSACSGLAPDDKCFSAIRTFVMEHAAEWSKYGAIYFKEAAWGDAEVKIAFDPAGGAWSALGKNSLSRDSSKPSMNLGWIDKGVVLHEFGHAIGLKHEQSSPKNILIFDEAAVFRYFREEYDYAEGEEPWSEAKIRGAVLDRYADNTRGLYVSESYDPLSIMQYWLYKKFVVNKNDCPAKNSPSLCIETNTQLSEIDKKSIAALYPNVQQASTAWAANTESLIAGNGGPWGIWHQPVYCPTGQFAFGMKMRVEPYRSGSGADDTTLNSVQLLCRPSISPYLEVGRFPLVFSHFGFWGDWTDSYHCGPRNYVTGFQLKVESRQDDGDDTAANSVNLACNDGNVLVGGGGPFGKWSAMKYCPAGKAVYGMQLRIEGKQVGDDDTALNDIKLFCGDLN